MSWVGNGLPKSRQKPLTVRVAVAPAAIVIVRGVCVVCLATLALASIGETRRLSISPRENMAGPADRAMPRRLLFILFLLRTYIFVSIEFCPRDHITQKACHTCADKRPGGPNCST